MILLEMKIKRMMEEELSVAIDALQRGEVIVYPTDTLYALGADIYNKEAVRRVFMVKHRPLSLPLPVAVSDVSAMEKIAVVDDVVSKVVKRLLPGELTVLLWKKDSVLDMVTGGSEKIAVRIPGNEKALALLSRFGPLTVTSANRHGEKTPGVIKELKMQFMKNVFVYLDDGRLDGMPSTIVDLTGDVPVVVREGAIPREHVLDAIDDG